VGDPEGRGSGPGSPPIGPDLARVPGCAEVIVVCDLFHVDTIWLRRPYSFFTVDHATGRWLAQQALTC
jgi:hypothetical protein